MSQAEASPISAGSNKRTPPYDVDFPPSLVREAVGLDVYEKAFLYLLTSHKNLRSARSRQDVERSLGFKIYEARSKLRQKGLIRWTEGSANGPTVYKLDKDALVRWVETSDAGPI